MIYTGLFLFIGFIGLCSAPIFHLPEWLFTIIVPLISSLILLPLIIYSLPSDEYEKKATKRLAEEFNRKYPEEDD